MKLRSEILQRRGAYVALRHDLHAHPELAYKEQRTSDLVATFLEGLGLEVHRGLAGTGVVAVLQKGLSTRAIGLRADMDALPVQEQNQFAHRSQHDGKMHACGHDGHTAMLLAAAEQLARHGQFDGRVVFIFQPAEETDGGARVMIEQGLFDRFPVDAVYGMHNWPGLPVGQFAVHRGPVMACADQFDIVVHGHGAHAAMPHQGRDPLVAAAALVSGVQGIVSRSLDPLDAAVISITRLFAGGEAYNIIPDQALLGGTVRAFREDVRSQIETDLRRFCAGIGAAHGVDMQFDYRRGYPPTINTAEQSEQCRAAMQALVGGDNVHTHLNPSMGAEDFAFMLGERPGCYVWIGNGLAEGGCMLHNPHYDFNDDILPLGASYWVELTERLLAE